MSYLAKRLREPVVDGSEMEFPVWWAAFMEKNSPAFKQLLCIRGMYDRVRLVLGDKWIQATLDSDSALWHDELGGLTEVWESRGTVEELKDMHNEINLETAAEYLRNLLEEFDPMWVQRPEEVEHGVVVLKNTRSEANKVAAKNEKDAILRELDAFDAALIPHIQAKRRA
jgi:hypothetical protein